LQFDEEELHDQKVNNPGKAGRRNNASSLNQVIRTGVHRRFTDNKRSIKSKRQYPDNQRMMDEYRSSRKPKGQGTM
jgi:hypothetical protein